MASNTLSNKKCRHNIFELQNLFIKILCETLPVKGCVLATVCLGPVKVPEE